MTMTWPEFLEELKAREADWSKFKEQFEGEEKKFFKKSYLVTVSEEFPEVQVPFSETDVMGIFLAAPCFFEEDKNTVKYYSLAAKFKKLKENDNESAKKILEELKEFDVNNFTVMPHRAEVRFPYVNMDLIQKAKQAPCCDKARTDMSRVSIKVVLGNSGRG